MTGKKTGQIPINSAILSIKSIGLCKRWQTQGAFRKRLIKDNRKREYKRKPEKDTYKMYDIAKKITGYSKAPDSGSGKSWGGQYREYVMDLLNKPSITIEIGSSVAPCPYWQYEIEFQKNRYVVVRIANALK